MLEVGDRVRWVHNEPGADYNELHGEVMEIDFEEEYPILVKWDDGNREWENDQDLAKE